LLNADDWLSDLLITNSGNNGINGNNGNIGNQKTTDPRGRAKRAALNPS
jgi:hypothetical protein